MVSLFFFSPQELLQLENLCKQLYETADTSLRSEAEKALVAFADSPDCLNKCQLLLERGNVSHSLHLTCRNARQKLENFHFVLQNLFVTLSKENDILSTKMPTWACKYLFYPAKYFSLSDSCSASVQKIVKTAYC